MSGEVTGPPAGLPEPRALRDAAAEIARAAGAVLLEGYGRAHAPEHKGRIDLVTAFDRRSEALVLGEIGRRYPDHAVLAEESGARVGAARVRWIVDPLDGTTNFAHNYPFFAVSIGVEVDGALAAGVVYDPVRDELFAAAAGHGATLNGAPIYVSPVTRVEGALLVTGFPYDVREDPERYLGPFRAFLLRAQGIRRDGSAALNLCYAAMGRFDGFWERGLSAWDAAAGVLMVTEAGGRVTRFDGEPVDLDGREFLATNGALHPEMMEVLAPFVEPRIGGRSAPDVPGGGSTDRV
ncbi:MAG: inositol monophosphatase family protein [Candidatus Eisenbacteria bacterium]